MVTKRKLTPGKLLNPAAKTITAPTIEPATSEPVITVRRKELVERIVARSGMKPNAVKTLLDAVLVELGDALSAGESLNIHPLGKVTVNRKKELEDREVLICKIRRKAATPETAPFSTAAE